MQTNSSSYAVIGLEINENMALTNGIGLWKDISHFEFIELQQTTSLSHTQITIPTVHKPSYNVSDEDFQTLLANIEAGIKNKVSGEFSLYYVRKYYVESESTEVLYLLNNRWYVMTYSIYSGLPQLQPWRLTDTDFWNKFVACSYAVNRDMKQSTVPLERIGEFEGLWVFANEYTLLLDDRYRYEIGDVKIDVDIIYPRIDPVIHDNEELFQKSQRLNDLLRTTIFDLTVQGDVESLFDKLTYAVSANQNGNMDKIIITVRSEFVVLNFNNKYLSIEVQGYSYFGIGDGLNYTELITIDLEKSERILVDG
jgi:hypothetical protein